MSAPVEKREVEDGMWVVTDPRFAPGNPPPPLWRVRGYVVSSRTDGRVLWEVTRL